MNEIGVRRKGFFGVHRTGVLVSVIILCPLFLVAQPVAKQGVIDLRGIDFNSNTSVPLNGEWNFAWKKLIPPDQIDSIAHHSGTRKFPHLWNNDPQLDSYGYATYHVKILLPEEPPSLALTIPDLYTAYTLYINGTEVSRNGRVANNREDYKPYWLPKTISIDQFNSGELNLVLHISNFRHSKGGVRLPIIIGNEEFLQRERAVELGYLLLLAGNVFMTGLIFLGLYSFGRHEKPILYFAIFCLVFTYRIIGTELYPLHYLFPDIPWILTIRLEYFSLYFAAAIFGLFVLNLYPGESSKKVIYTLTGILLGFSLSALILPPYYFTQLINPFFTLIPIYILYTTWVYIRAALNKREGSGFALASTVAVFLVFIHNLLEYYVVIEENLIFSFLGFFSFFFLQALILAYRFTNSLNRAKIKAEEAARVKSQFLSTMSHEIRTPLNAVIGLSELLIESNSPKEKKEFAQNIKSSGENLLEIINNILDYSKFESSEVELDLTPVHLHRLITEITTLLKPLSQSKKLDIRLNIGPDVPEWILADATRLKQILINLVGNSIKFTEKGSISIHAEEKQDPEIPGNLFFKVEDTGLGIPKNKMNRLFKSFSQVESGSTREHGGTGLGLVISKKLVEAMNGAIWVESEKDKGTTFFFTITAKVIDQPEQSQPLSPLPEKENSTNKQLKVLLAEDNILNQKVAVKILEKANLQPEIVGNGQEAVEKNEEEFYDLIFMDMEMPVMDGIEATKKIRNKSKGQTKQPVIVAMTANAFAEDRERCLKAGMDDFIAKPVSIASIRKVLNKWFS